MTGFLTHSCVSLRNRELSRAGKPLHRIRRLSEITNWFEKYAKE